MADPLTKSQQALRGKKVSDMTETELVDWIDACSKMALHVKPAKARRSWKSGGIEAEQELQKRAGRSQQ